MVMLSAKSYRKMITHAFAELMTKQSSNIGPNT